MEGRFTIQVAPLPPNKSFTQPSPKERGVLTRFAQAERVDEKSNVGMSLNMQQATFLLLSTL